jgi:N-acetyltransferase 10
LVIDEAAAIPLPLVKSLFGPYLIFLASTISGYEGTGRSLSLKLIQQLRVSGNTGKTSDKEQAKGTSVVTGRTLREVLMEQLFIKMKIY